ncbi:MAG: hypothetical protein V4732_20065 [Pseudomonadota bacterium]
MKTKRTERTNHFFKSRVERGCFYISALLFAGMIIGLYFVSGVYFYPSVNNIFIYYIPMISAVFWIVGGVVAFVRLSGNPDALKASMGTSKSGKPPKLWVLRLIAGFLFLCVSVGPLISFLLWSNAMLLSKAFSHQVYEEVVELQRIGINNYRRKNMLKVTFHSEKISDPIRVDIKRDNMKVNGYNKIIDGIQVNKLVCIKGYQAPWGLVINEVVGARDCNN